MKKKKKKILPKLKTEVPGPESQKLSQRLANVESHNITYRSDDFPIFMKRAKDCMIIDVDDNRFIDYTSAFGVSFTGHRPKHLKAALTKQSKHLIHGMGDVHPSKPKLQLIEKLINITPKGLDKVILGINGCDSIEAAIKTSLIYTGKPFILAFTNAYHGLSFGTLNLTSNPLFKGKFKKYLHEYSIHVPYPYCYRCHLNKHFPSCNFECMNSINDILVSNKYKSKVAAVIYEPIQGRGGVILPPSGWLKELRDLCHKNNVILIADEIFTGFGRTGKMFASEVTPDILVVGKAMTGGLPVSACIGRKEIIDAWDISSGEAIHTYTFLGNPLACHLANKNIDYIIENNIPKTTLKKGKYLNDKLIKLKNLFPDIIGDVRSAGLFAGIEFVNNGKLPDKQMALSLTNFLLKHGAIVLPSGTKSNIISITPPVKIKKKQINYLIDTIIKYIGSSYLS